MILFWLLAAALATGITAVVVRPLLNRRGTVLDRSEYDLMVYRDQLGEVDRDAARGLLSKAQAEAARLEIQRRMLAADAARDKAVAETQSPDQAPAAKASVAKSSGIPKTATALGLGLPLVGALFYALVTGSPGMPDQPLASRLDAQGNVIVNAPPAPGSPEEAVAQQAMVARAEALEEAIADDPEDLESLLALAALRRALDQIDEAAALLARAVTVQPDNAEIMAEWGQAQVMAARGQVTAPAADTFLRALRLDRNQPVSRFFLGMARIQQGDAPGGLAIWRDLSNDTAPDAPWREMLSDQIAQVATATGIAPISVQPIHPLDIPAFPETAGDQPPDLLAQGENPDPSAGDQLRAEADANRAPGQGFSDDEQTMIAGMVGNLAAKLEAEPDDPEGWMMLGRSYLVLERPAEAIPAFREAVARHPDAEIEPRRQLAHALIARSEAAGETEPPAEVFALMTEILERAPGDGEALFFAGLDAERQGDGTTARTHWEALIAMLPAESPFRLDLQSRLDRLPD
ncbi:MAG: c-type cytochrome biogenesis protein CcmI [Rhodospirillaceae bacterium]